MEKDADRWLGLAKDSFEAAKDADEKKKYRSAVSRAYYALFQAATAILVHARVSVPERGNWPHIQVPALFQSPTVRTMLPKGSRVYRQAIIDTYTARISADYRPRDTVDREQSRMARRYSGMVLNLAMKVVGNDS